jgi:hypothetical protein
MGGSGSPPPIEDAYAPPPASAYEEAEEVPVQKAFDPQKAALREDWYKDPLVKKVLETFNGDIVDIYKAKE